MASNVTLKYGDLTEKIPLFGGRLHIPTIKDAFALRGIRVADTLAPFDNEGLTLATFEPGDTLNISGTPAELPAMPGTPHSRGLLQMTLSTIVHYDMHHQHPRHLADCHVADTSVVRASWIIVVVFCSVAC